MCILKIFSPADSFKSYALSAPLPVYSVYDADDIRSPTTGKRYGVFRISGGARIGMRAHGRSA